MKNKKIIRLNNIQKEIFEDCNKNTESIKHNNVILYRFDDYINTDRLKKSLIKTINHHNYMKTRLIKDNNEIKLNLNENIEIEDIPIIQLENTDETIIKKEIKPFNLINNQLFSFKIFESENETILFTNFSDILFDDYSVKIFFNDLQKIYNYENPSNIEDTFEYYLKENEKLSQNKIYESQEYYKKLLSISDKSTILNPDKFNKEEGKCVNSTIEIEKEELNKYCNANNINLNDLFLTSTILALNKFTFSSKSLIYTVINNRDSNIMGNFDEILPFIIDLNNREINIKDCISTICNRYEENLKHPYSINKFTNEYDLKSEFIYSYTKNNNDNNNFDRSISKAERLNIPNNPSNYLDINEYEDKIVLSIYYNTNSYSKYYMDLFLESINSIINQILKNNINDYKISDIALKEEEKEIKFEEIKHPLIHEFFEDTVNENLNKTALICEDATLTYDELNKKANKIAHALIKRNIKPGSRILFMLPRNSNIIACIFGILKAGCVFIPLDLLYPKERLEYIRIDSGADYVITQDDSENGLNIEELLLEENDTNPNLEINPENEAYILYTSGSTGRPKGVVHRHRDLTNIYQKSEKNDMYTSFMDVERAISISPVAFDAFLSDFNMVMRGALLVFANEEEIKDVTRLIKLILKYNVDSVPFISASRLEEFMEYPEFTKLLSNFRYICIGGEKASKSLVKKILEHPNSNIYNIYGSTETISISFTKIDENNALTIGSTVYNCIADIRDIDGKLVPRGIIGELYAGGLNIAKEYNNNPKKTEETFKTINNISYIRSGDYALELPTGEIEIKGRVDTQIKLRGQRIEVEEIEFNINEYTDIKHSTVVVKEVNGGEHLCAYFTASNKINTNELKTYLKDKLTSYMIPTFFMQLDQIPKTPTGKIDPKRLPEIKVDYENVKPETETEKEIYEFIAQSTDTKDFGITDDLYTLGFTSLTLMKLNNEVYEKMDIVLDINKILNTPTIKAIAKEIDEAKKNKPIKEDKEIKILPYYPLTPNQLGVYYECIKDENNLQYNIPMITHFDKEINSEKLKEAIIKTINNHTYLKTRIINENGQIKQKRCDNEEFDNIEIIKTNNITDEEIIKNNLKAFKLDKDQLFRFKIYETSNEIILFSDFHHIITDGASQGILYDEIAKTYENSSDIRKEAIDGYEYSLLENNLDTKASMEFFKEKLEKNSESTILTPNLNGDENKGKTKKIIKKIDLDKIHEFTSKEGISPNILFMSSTMLTLNKYTLSTDSLITTIFNGRLNPNYYNTQAMLVKTLPLILDISNRKQTIKEFITNVDKNWKDTLTNTEYPYTKISEEYQLKPEFFYAYHQNLDLILNINGKKYKSTPITEDTNQTEYKISFDIYENQKDIMIVLSYNDQLYSPEFLEQFINSIEKTIKQFIDEDINTYRICDVHLEEENDNPNFTPVKTPILHKHFEQQVSLKPDDIALVSDETLTYNELNEKANQIANALINKGVEKGSNILIMLPRTHKLIATILGVLKAGCAFIPIDLDYPAERIKYIYENSQADYIIANETTENSLNIDELLLEENTDNPGLDVSKDDLAYMIYTSGSTGKPKGVMIGHENACNEVEANPKANYSNLLSIATIAFDTSLEDLLTGLTNGIKIIFANDNQIKDIVDLTKLIQEYKPEVMEFTPSRLLSYLEFDDFCSTLKDVKCIIMGGEQFSTKAFVELRKYTDAKVYNSYGPTEATIASNYKEITDPDNVTIGKALQNYITDVRDIDGNPVPAGVMGELYIGGTGVGKGYYNMPEKTEEVFLTIDNIPFYKSGDYAIELPNGEIDIKGRIDNQIKLRGLRIEIEEIENSINKYDGIKQCVVLIRKINNNDHLCAYFTAETEIDTKSLKEFLKNSLTKYMIPTAFMQLDVMPQTPNGKTDIKNLPEPTLDFENIKPENEAEEKLLKLASNLIETDEFGTTDDLYTVGFTSLTLMKLNSQIYKEFNNSIDTSILFNNPTIRNITKELESSEKLDYDIEELVKESEEIEYYALTENQLGVYYECMQNVGEIKYTLPSLTRFDKSIIPSKLKEAIVKTIESHPYLKTRLVTTVEGEIKQKRDDNIEIDEIPIIKADSITVEEISQNDVKAFNLENNQLFRFKIYETSDEVLLFADIHHIISDGVSLGNLLVEIANNYQNKPNDEEIVDGYVYSLIEEKEQSSSHFVEAKKFFQDKLNEIPDSTILTPNLNGNPDEGKIKFIYDVFESEYIKNFAQEHAIGPNTLFVTAIVLALNKFTFSDKTLITTIYNGRLNPNYFNTQGFLVKTMPLIINSNNRELSIKEFIKTVDTDWKDTIHNSIYPYTKIAEEYQLKPEFFYSYEEGFDDSIIIDGKEYETIELSNSDAVATEYKISLGVSLHGNKVGFELEYNDQLYTEGYVKEFLETIKHILIQFLTSDLNSLRLCDLETIKAKEIPELIPVENPVLHNRFEQQVLLKPDEIALVSDETLTYNELNEKANQIANALINKGVEKGSNILIMLPRTHKLIATILGVLKAGCAFIPIDIDYPAERIKYIYENSQADYIIANETTDTTINIDELLKEENTDNPNVYVNGDDLAYMIYTSGSTGKPKGVMIGHENACNEVEANPKANYSNLLSIATIAFDTSLEDLLTGLTNGIKIIFANDNQIKDIVDLTKLIQEYKPEVMEFTPSRLLSYLEFDDFCSTLKDVKCIIMGGEQFSTKAFVELRKYTDAKVYNSYGPTEATIASNYKEITDPDNVTIGKALQNYITDVRDIDGNPVPAGVMGELYIGGTGVGKGYYNMPEKTEEVFLTIDNIPFYKSGDYAIELPNGEIDIKGRIDNQIKLRGLRIEIEEIENNINKYNTIKQCTVVIKEINNNDHLCAYFTADEDINIDDLKEFLRSKLTKYMIPTVFTQLDELPQTPNGKIDTKKLPEPKLELTYVAPENKLEQLICAIFSSILKIETVGATDNFFEIGGTSLVASKLIVELLKRDYKVQYEDIFNNQTPRELAQLLSGENNTIDVNIDIIKDYDYSDINNLLEENTVQNFFEGEQEELGNILLTGVTGFLGIHILSEYLKDYDGIVYCMVRKGSFESCEERLKDLLDFYFDGKYTDLIGSRIILVEGDVTEIDDFNKFSNYDISTIINSAAIVKHYTYDDYIFKVNVDGVINGLKFAEHNNLKYIQISTTSVLMNEGDSSEIEKDIVGDEKLLYYGQELTNKYLNSKFLAERMVLEAGVKGLNTKIMRVGNLMSRYDDGKFQRNYDTNAFLNSVKAIANIEAIPYDMYVDEVEMSPIDYTARAILKLCKTPKECRVFHCQNNNIIYMSNIINVLNSFDYDISAVSVEEFAMVVQDNMDESIQGLITSDLYTGDFEEGEEVEASVEVNQTSNILNALGFYWPQSDMDYLKRLITYLKSLDFL